ncbi:MAG: hypothetical protein U0525_00780 [Patescibacteria group bacterium]
MNQDINPIELVLRDIGPSQMPAVVLPTNPSPDAVSAGLALYFALGKQGKQAMIACPTPVNYDIPGVEHVKTSFTGGGRNLVISFPYTDGSVDKVDYRIENGSFNLIVIPREGFEKITPEQMSYSYQGGQPDTFITMGVGNLQSLGKLYQDNKEILDTLPLVVVNKQKPAISFGSSEFYKENALLTEIALDLIQNLEIQLDQNIATVAFAGLATSTNNFTNDATTPESFELAGKLLRMGAKKQNVQKPKTDKPQSQRPQESQNERAAENQRRWLDKNRGQQNQPQKPKNDGQNSQSQRPNQNIGKNPARPQNPNFGAQKPARPERPVMNKNQAPQSERFETAENNDFENTSENVQENRSNAQAPNKPLGENQKESNSNGTPQDWLKPKIFKGGGFI